MSKLYQWCHNLLDILAPARCLQCLREGTWLCRACAETLPLEATCTRYKNTTPLIGIVSAGSYGTPYIQRGVHWLKFKRVTDIAPILAALVSLSLPLIAPMHILQREAVLISIPLHKRRLRQRGFNQSLEIARVLAQELNIPIADVLTRSRPTLAQAKLPADMRAENVSDAFSLTETLPNKRYILLLDDVTTTGSTLSAAAQVLKSAGADQVWGVTVARG